MDVTKKFAGMDLNDCVKWIRDLNHTEAECEELIQGLMDMVQDRVEMIMKKNFARAIRGQ
jgi:hypothetical protein